jgi:hypothetical protein
MGLVSCNVFQIGILSMQTSRIPNFALHATISNRSLESGEWGWVPGKSHSQCHFGGIAAPLAAKIL